MKKKALVGITAMMAGLLLTGTGWADAKDAKDAKARAERGERRGEASSQTMLFGTDLIKQKVTNAEGREIGHIDELVVDSSSGQIKYAVVSLGSGFMGMGNKSVTIPWEKLTTKPSTDGYLTMIDEGVLRQAPEFNRTAYRGGSDAGRTAQLQTFRGTVVSVEPVDRTGQAQTLTALRIRTDQGVQVVRAGREWQEQHAQLNLKPGDEIVVRGHTTGFGGQSAIAAQEITANGKTVRLSTDAAPYRETGGEQNNNR